MPVVPRLSASRKPNAADYNRLADAAVQDPTPTAPVAGQVRLDNRTLEVYYGATTGWQKPWATPWGLTGSWTRSAASGGVAGTTYADIPTLTSGSVTYLQNRVLRIEAELTLRQRTSAGLVQAGINIGGSITKTAWFSRATDEYATFHLTDLLTTTSSAVTIKVQAKTSANTIDLEAEKCWLIIHDLGPSGAAPAS